jgi:indole-3-glycerol phosphate synthase
MDAELHVIRTTPEVQVTTGRWTPPTGTLGRILDDTRRRVDVLRTRDAELASAATAAERSPSLTAALGGPLVGVIAEVKRRSPSKGTINDAISSAAQAAAFASGGAKAISVLTEPSFFGGSEADLRQAREVVDLPLLRKDFHVDPVQLVEARALGAAAVLLIARALEPFLFLLLFTAARDLGLEALVEVRNEAELDRALSLGARLIGVNSRDLETLEVDRSLHRRLMPRIPADCIAVAESGIASPADVLEAAQAGADAVLVGSAISASSDPAQFVRGLTGVAKVSRNG